MSSSYDHKILIISTSKKREYEVGLYNYLKSYGYSVNIVKIDNLITQLGIDSHILYRTQNIKNKYDVIIPFIDRKYLTFYSIILKVFEEENAETYITSEYIKYAHNSNLLINELHKYNIPSLKTYIAISTKAFQSIIEKLEFPLVIKIIGKNKKIIVKSRESMTSILDTIESIKKYLIIKEIFPNTQYEEYLYIDGQLFGILYKNGKGEIEEIKPSKKIENISNRIHDITKSKIINFGIYRDENNKIFFDDLFIPENIEDYINIYGNKISLAISKSLIKHHGIKDYLRWFMTNFKFQYFFRKKKHI